MIQLSKKIAINAIDYASQGNAVLGIRGSGKTYTATFIAENLMDEKIPIIVFDPIGVWRYLKVAESGKGYPVVVAGDDGDLPLTAANAADIVRAAMKENAECWTTVKTFMAEKRPEFIEPFVDLWNIFALRRNLIQKPIRITDHRRKKFDTRIREAGFDFIAVLTEINKSNFLKGGNDRQWMVDFEFIIHSEENYTKILEGKYK